MNAVLKSSRWVLGVLGFLAGIAGVIAAIAFVGENAFRTLVMSFHPDGATVAAHCSWMIRQWLYLFPALLIGVTAAKLAHFRPRAYLIVMACIQGLLIVRALIFAPPQPVPPWLWTQTLLVTPIPIWFVGWLQLRHPSKPETMVDGFPPAIHDGG